MFIVPFSKKSNQNEEKNEHLFFIDGLRSIAILWVIIFHCLHFLPHYSLQHYLSLRDSVLFSPVKWGFYGVDIFFVVSGFIISYLLFKEWKDNHSINVKGFFIRRAARILPAYYLVLFIFFLISANNWENMWANFLYVNNFLSIKEQFMPWAWSLAIEEQFYIIFPFLFIMLMRTNRKLSVLFAVFVIAVVIRILVVALYNIEFPPPHSQLGSVDYYNFFDNLYGKLHTRFGGFVVGIFVGYLCVYTDIKSYLEKNYKHARLWLVISLIFLLPSLIAYEPNVDRFVLYQYFILTLYPYVFSVTIGYIILYCFAFRESKSRVGWVLSHPIFYPISKLSYSAYLVHPIAIFLTCKILNIAKLEAISSLDYMMILSISLFITFSSATLIYNLVEKPIIRLGRYHAIKRELARV